MAGSQDIFVRFGADTGGLEAALALAKANVQGMTRELASMAREMRKTGADADSELGQRMAKLGADLAATKAQSASISGSLSGLAGGLDHVGAAAAHGHTGLGFYVREVHALFDELGSGRDRQAVGTLSNLIGATLQSNLALIPWAAAIGAAAAALGYLAYQTITANNAIRSVQLDAVIAQFTMTDAQARALVADVKDLAGVGNSAAGEIAKPFLALGPGGDIVARLASQYIPLLAQQMGEDAPKAAAKLAEMFVELSSKGREYVAQTVGVTAAQLAAYDGFVASGQSGQAWGVLLDALRTRLGAAKDAQLEHNAAVKAAIPTFDEATSGVIAFESGEQRLGAQLDATTQKVEEQDMRLRAYRSALDQAASAQRTFMAGYAESFKVDKIAGEIRETTLEIDKLKAALGAARNTSGNAEAIQQISRSLDIAGDKLAKLKEQYADGPLGRDALKQAQDANAMLADTHQGPQVDLLTQQRDKLQAVANAARAGSQEQVDAAKEVADKTREIRDAENESYLRQEEIKVAAAGKNSALIVSIRQAGVAREIALYGEGSKQAEVEEDKLARAKGQAADRGAAAAKTAAKEQLAGEQESYAQQIGAAEKTAQEKLKLYGLELRAKQITETEKLQLTLAALAEEKSAVGAAQASELALAGNNARKIEELQGQIKTFNLENAFAIQDAQEAAAIKTTQAWDSATKAINNDFTGQIAGLLTGTESWHSAFKKVVTDLTEQLIKFGVDWGLTITENAAKQILLGNQVVAQHVAGDTVKAAADASAAGAGLGAQIASANLAIGIDVKQAAAGIAAFLAPFFGPAAVPAGLAAAGGIGMADIGAWNVPSDQLMFVHKNEMIATPSQAAGLRGLVEGGGAAGGGGGRPINISPAVTFHSSAPDAAGVAQFFRSNQREMMKAVNEAVRQGAHLGLRGLTRR